MSYVIHTGSNLDVLPTLPDNSIDAIVTDPPYGLEFMGNEWDAPWKQGGSGFSKPGIGDRPTQWPSFTSTSKFGAINPTCKKCKGRLRGAKKCFCDNPEWKPIGKRRNPENEGLPSDVTSSGMANQMRAFQEWYYSVAVQMYRVLKPGGHIVSFGGSRTYHRMASALEDAGFEIRDQMMWIYGSGFPKSHNISKALDKAAATTAAAKQWDGWGTALKPAHEPICLARKPIEGTVADNVLKWGVGGLNIDGCRVQYQSDQDKEKAHHNALGMERLKIDNGEKLGSFDGGWKKHKPTLPAGRFPANLIHDGSQQVLDLFPYSKSTGGANGGKLGDRTYGKYKNETLAANAGGLGDEGSAARFFYCPKTSKEDRNQGCEALEDKEWKTDGACIPERGDRPFNPSKNNHPTVKPTELMRYLCRLITPPGGTVLDPFNGSGSTGKAAVLEGFNYVGIELNPEYVKIAEARIKAVL